MMTKYTSRAVAWSWLVLGASLPAFGGTGSIVGNVKDDGGTPVEYVSVFALVNGALVQGRITSTDGDGNYAITGMDAGTYEVKIKKGGYATQLRTGIVVTDGNQTVLNVTDLALEGIISGTVSDYGGSPALSDIILKVDCGGGLVFITTSDGSGNYQFKKLPAGTFTVTALKARLSFADQTDVIVTAGNTTANVDFEAALRRKGNITDDQAVPVEGADIYVREPGQGDTVGIGRTDDQGNYAISDLDAGTYDVRVEASGYVAQLHTGIVLEAESQTLLNVTDLTAAGAISGRCTESDGSTAIPGVAMQVDCGGGVVLGADTDETGNYVIQNVPAGTFTVTAFDPYSTFTDQTGVEVTAGATTGNIDFQAAAKGKIAGVLTEADGSTPVVGAMVIVSKGIEPHGSTATTDATGAYEIENVPPGAGYTVAAWDGIELAEATSLAVTAGQTTTADLTAAGGSISGTVEDAGGVGIAGATLKAFSFESTLSTYPMVTTDANGNYTIEPLEQASYEVQVEAGGYVARKIASVSVTQGQQTSGQDFTLGPEGLIAGRVTAASGGGPLSDVFVVAVDWGQSDDPSWTSVAATTDGNGNYTLGYLTAGTYEVFVTVDGHVTDSTTGISVSAGQTTSGINFSLSSTGGAIAGTVYEPDGSTPIAGAMVSVYSPGNGSQYGFTDENGGYTLSLLLPGTYTVKAVFTGYVVGELTDVTVTGTQTNPGNDFSLQEEE